MVKEKINAEIREQLFSTNTQSVLTAIRKIKNQGNKLYIPLLFDLLCSNPEKEIEDEIKDLLATVKDKTAIESYVQALQNKKYKSIWKIVLTSCWQNGLDFSDFTPIFTELIINEDWDIAFEAFTIIDNLEFLPPQNTIEESVEKINNALKTANQQKSYLLNEVLLKLT